MINIIIYQYQRTSHDLSILFTNSRCPTNHIAAFRRYRTIKKRTCSISDNFCRTIKSCTTFNVTHAISIARLTSALLGTGEKRKGVEGVLVNTLRNTVNSSPV